MALAPYTAVIAIAKDGTTVAAVEDAEISKRFYLFERYVVKQSK
ncbi:MAG: hypothetical protein WC528_00750 [Patescibacteria group bacterium]